MIENALSEVKQVTIKGSTHKEDGWVADVRVSVYMNIVDGNLLHI